MLNRTHRIVTAAIVTATAVLATNVNAAVLVWDGGGANQFFGTADNWDLNQGPTNADDVFFPAQAVAPTLTPLWSAADSVLSISVDNSGGYIWQLPRDGAATPRSITIGSGGLSVTGGGQTDWGAVTTSVNGAQNWTVGAATTLNFTTGATIGGNGKITKLGDGTLILPNASNTNVGGWDVMAGVLVNQRSTQGAGANGSLVSVFNTGVYESRNNIASAAIKLYDGATLRGNGVGVGVANGQPVTIDTAADSSVTLSTVAANNTFSITPSITGGTANSLITISGPGLVALTNGSSGVSSAATYAGSWKIQSGTFRIADPNALGVLNGVGRPVELAGGSVSFALNGNGTTSMGGAPAFTVSAPSTVIMERTTTANSGNTTRNAGPLSINNSALTFVVGTIGLNGVQTYTVNFTTTTLTGNATFDISNGLSSNLADPITAVVRLGAVGESSAGKGFTKSGNASLHLISANTYTGATVVTGGTLLFGNTAGLSTSSITIAAGANVNLNNGANTQNWTTKADLAGSGTLSMFNSNQTLNLQGSSISPGSSPGILTINGGAVALAKDGAEFSALNIDITGTADTPGTDYDQLAIASTLTGLANTDLFVNLSGIIGDISGKTITIVTSASDFTGLAFNSVTFSPLWSGDVNYLNGSITLTNLAAIPEPASLALLALGGLLMIRRRHAK